MSDEAKRERGRRLQELRLALGFATQEALSDAAGDSIERTYVNRIENGKNALTSVALQRALAEALGLRVEDFADYLDGGVSLVEILRRRDDTMHGRGPVDLKAVVLVHAIEKLPGLRKWIEKNPSKLTVADLIRGVAVYEENKPRAREDGEPLNGWGSFFDDALAGRITRATRGNQAAAEALEAKQLTPGTRRALQAARKKT